MPPVARTSRVPLLNLAHYRSGDAAQRRGFVDALGNALREFGFVSVEGHGVDAELIRRTYDDAARFFALPEKVKRRYLVEGGAGQRGYTGFGQEHAKDRTVGDLKEFWHVGRDLPPGHPHLSDYGNNLWPEEVPDFRPHTQALFQALDACAGVLLEALAEYFSLPRRRFADMAVDGNSILRLIHYPPLKGRFVPGAVRAAEHEDINLITLLCEGTASGLEILTRDGTWLPVDTLQGQIVVDSGDMLSRATNDRIPATTHRVVNPKGPEEDIERYSMPFFVHPYPECSLAPHERFGPPRHPPITADAYLKQRLKEIGLAPAGATGPRSSPRQPRSRRG